MTFLYYVAAYLTAAKIMHDLDAWTAESSRSVDLTGFVVIATVMFLLTLLMGAV